MNQMILYLEKVLKVEKDFFIFMTVLRSKQTKLLLVSVSMKKL